MTEFPDVAAVLRKGGERIARTGLTKGKLYEWGPSDSTADTCKVCSFGAVNYAITGHPQHMMVTVFGDDRERAWDLFNSAETYLLQAIEQENPGWFETHEYGGVPEFNDDPATTSEQVVHVFAVAAANAERDDRTEVRTEANVAA